MELIEKYIASWNETDPAARRNLIDEVWAADGRYTDPLADAAGRDQIDAVIAAVQTQCAGLELSLAGPIDAHHDIARLSWTLGPRGAGPVVAGVDVAVIQNGRIATVHGFLDRLPA